MILITGASGLIGRALARCLLEAGETPRLQGRRRASVMLAIGGRAGDCDIREFDFSCDESERYEELVEGCSAVIHCGGIVHQPAASREDYAICNVRATRHLADATAKSGVATFVLLSTSAVYGDGPFENISEDVSPTPHSAYGLSKLNCEEALRRVEALKRTIVFRPSLVFGEGDRGNMAALIRQVRKRLYFHIAGNNAKKSVIYSRDAAGAILLSLAKLPEGFHLFNLSNPQPMRLIELGEAIANVCGQPPPHSVPQSLLRTSAMLAEKVLGSRSPLTQSKLDKLMTTTTLSVDKLVEATGFEPEFTVEEALRRELVWLESRS